MNREEEILNDNGFNIPKEWSSGIYKDRYERIKITMQENAREMSIGFVEYFQSDENPYQYQYDSDDDNNGKWYNYFSEGINRHYLTTSQVYTKYLEYLQSLNTTK